LCFGTVLPQYFLYWKLRFYGFMGLSCYHPLEFAHLLQEDAWKAWKRLNSACELVKVCNNKMENLLKIFRKIKSISNQYVLINLLCTYAVWGLKMYYPAVRCLLFDVFWRLHLDYGVWKFCSVASSENPLEKYTLIAIPYPEFRYRTISMHATRTRMLLVISSVSLVYGDKVIGF